MTTPTPSVWGFGARTAHQGTNVPAHGDGMGSSTTPSSAAPRHGSIQSGPASGTQQQATFGSNARTEAWYSQRPRCAPCGACPCGPPSAGSTPAGASYEPLTADQLRSWQQRLEHEQRQIDLALHCARAGYGSSSAEQSGRATPCNGNLSPSANGSHPAGCASCAPAATSAHTPASHASDPAAMAAAVQLVTALMGGSQGGPHGVPMGSTPGMTSPIANLAMALQNACGAGNPQCACGTGDSQQPAPPAATDTQVTPPQDSKAKKGKGKKSPITEKSKGKSGGGSKRSSRRDPSPPSSSSSSESSSDSESSDESESGESSSSGEESGGRKGSKGRIPYMSSSRSSRATPTPPPT